MKKKSWVTVAVIVLVIILAIIILTRSRPGTSEEIARCIGRNSKLYIQLGCHACETQKEIFGDNYQYLDVTDCWFEREKCGEIEYTPTWIIKGKKYDEVLSISTLQDLTGCK